ncbi:MAG: GNAT family N-acetyltransferase [Cyanobacteria bacterium J06597_1]
MISSISEAEVIEVRVPGIASALLAHHLGLRDRQISFVPAQFPQDLQFLSRVYASTRVDEMNLILGWSKEWKAAFLQQQFEAQHAYYQEHYGDAEFSIVKEGDRPIGRLYIDRWEDEFRIIDIALLCQARDRGIGTAILKAIQELARIEGCAVRIHVEYNNPALRLYRRLGFQKIGETGVYFLMEWKPKSL